MITAFIQTPRWKHIVRGKRLIPLDTRVIKLDIDQASSFFIYVPSCHRAEHRCNTVSHSCSYVIHFKFLTICEEGLVTAGWNQTGLVLHFKERLENRREKRSFSPSHRAPGFCPRARRGWFLSLRRNRKSVKVLVQTFWFFFHSTISENIRSNKSFILSKYTSKYETWERERQKHMLCCYYIIITYWWDIHIPPWGPIKEINPSNRPTL